VRDQLAGGGYEWFEDFVTIRRSMSCLPRHDGQHRKTKRLWHYADNSVLIGSNSNGAADHRCTAVKKTLPRTPRQNDDIVFPVLRLIFGKPASHEGRNS